ncbi:sugar phosphate isomerase/epimerase family protein [Conexibacter woesei]|uniref:Xylose isomerase domain protein TIM barrel n=1 Tax=Conexibacter woesei (strain DSM 14684 / CCUG 47730 / CIP 108061 / JCM 11494 / NBRC 100937 / ID131577) TaxID=469383 RepID=D3FD81_CONWI|nr:sugar phosphate isomerase/epimerase [Conexibacter woesei]ADB53473.1 Xylose isomerase domain protein TIM barrel [Conexibacter woesei DSM 14684]
MTDQKRPLAERLSCADSTFPRLSHETALRVIGDLGIAAVDVCVFAGSDHTPPADVVADPPAAADRVRRRLERCELAVADVFAILGSEFDELAVNHPDAQVRAQSLDCYRAVLDFARRLGAPGVTLLPGMPFDGVDADVGLALAAAELQRRAELAAEAGLRLAIEPHYQSIAETPARTLDLIGQAPDVTLALDHSHFVFQGFAQAEADALIPHAAHVHLRQAAPGVMQTRTGEGAIDFRALRDRLDADGYDGFLALEYQWEEWLDCTRVDCIAETAALRDLLLKETA